MQLNIAATQLVHCFGRFKRRSRMPAPRGLSKRPLKKKQGASTACIASPGRVDNNELSQYHYHDYYYIVSESHIVVHDWWPKDKALLAAAAISPLFKVGVIYRTFIRWLIQ